MSTACCASVVILGGVGKSTAVARIETTLAPAFKRKDRQGEVLEINGLFGTTLVIAGEGVSAARRARACRSG